MRRCRRERLGIHALTNGWERGHQLVEVLLFVEATDVQQGGFVRQPEQADGAPGGVVSVEAGEVDSAGDGSDRGPQALVSDQICGDGGGRGDLVSAVERACEVAPRQGARDSPRRGWDAGVGEKVLGHEVIGGDHRDLFAAGCPEQGAADREVALDVDDVGRDACQHRCCRMSLRWEADPKGGVDSCGHRT